MLSMKLYMEPKPKHLDDTSSILTPDAASKLQSPPAGTHPHLLLVYWERHTRSGQWQSALAVAESLVEALPQEPIGWLYRSFALQQLGRLREASQFLLKGARRFPADWRIAYNLASYACQLGDLAGAWNWLDRASLLVEADQVKSLALDDPGFKLLWKGIGQRPPLGSSASGLQESSEVMAFSA